MGLWEGEQQIQDWDNHSLGYLESPRQLRQVWPRSETLSNNRASEDFRLMAKASVQQMPVELREEPRERPAQTISTGQTHPGGTSESGGPGAQASTPTAADLIGLGYGLGTRNLKSSS